LSFVERERGEGFSVAREARTACRGSLGLLLFLAGVLMLPGVADGAEGARGHGASGDLIVKVDGEPVTRGDVLRRVRAAKGNIEPSTMDPEEWRRIVATATKSEIVDRLLLKAALAGGMKIDSEKLERSVGDMKEELGEARFRQVLDMRSATEEEFREFIRQRMLMEKYKAALFKDASIAEDAVKKHLGSYSLPARASLEIMVLEDGESSGAALERLRNGEEFATVAAAYGSGGRNSSEGGERTVSLDTLPADLQSRVRAARAGELLGPLKASDGTYIIRVGERWEAGPPDYDEISDGIRKELLEKEKLAILDAWYEAEKQKAVIEYQ